MDLWYQFHFSFSIKTERGYMCEILKHLNEGYREMLQLKFVQFQQNNGSLNSFFSYATFVFALFFWIHSLMIFLHCLLPHFLFTEFSHVVLYFGFLCLEAVKNPLPIVFQNGFKFNYLFYSFPHTADFNDKDIQEII